MREIEVNEFNHYLPVDYNEYSVIKGYIVIHDANYVKELELGTKNCFIFYKIRDSFYMVHISKTDEEKYVHGFILESKEEIYEHLLELRQFVKVLGGIYSADGKDDLMKKIGVWINAEDYVDCAYDMHSAITKMRECLKISNVINYDEYKEYCEQMGRKNV